MPKPSTWTRQDVLDVALRQHHLITAAQLSTLGVPSSTVSRSDEIGGMFSRVLPGVHRVDGRGALTEDQRDFAALLYGGDGTRITGTGLLRRYAVKAAFHPALGPNGRVHLLVPHARKRESRGFVHVERTVAVLGGRSIGLLQVAPVARAVLDAARGCTDQDAVRALVFEVVQRRMAAPEQLEDERLLGQKRGSRFARLALEEVAAGVRSVPEADIRLRFEASGVVGLLYNPRLVDASGGLVACPDVYDPATGVCLEVDSREFHFSVTSWEATMARHARMTSYGLAVIHVPPSRISRDPGAVVRQFSQTQRVRTGWPGPPVYVDHPADGELSRDGDRRAPRGRGKRSGSTSKR